MATFYEIIYFFNSFIAFALLLTFQRSSRQSGVRLGSLSSANGTALQEGLGCQVQK